MISRENNTAVFTDGKFRLRCRLMPCIYSEMAAVHLERSTMMRMPAFDFRQDAEARNIGDQFMFGRALMVCPVLRAEKRWRRQPEGISARGLQPV